MVFPHFQIRVLMKYIYRSLALAAVDNIDGAFIRGFSSRDDAVSAWRQAISNSSIVAADHVVPVDSLASDSDTTRLSLSSLSSTEYMGSIWWDYARELPTESDMWVVYRGRTPGLYNTW
jgi:hypothetical protein